MGVDVQSILELGAGLFQVGVLGLGAGVELGEILFEGGGFRLGGSEARENLGVAFLQVSEGGGVL